MPANPSTAAPRTFADDIERAADGAPILAVVIGPFGWGDDDDDESAYGWGDRPRGAPVRHRVRLDWSDARPMLDYAYGRGFGAPDCHAFIAWTRTHVLTLHEYDGSTSIMRALRNPPRRARRARRA